MALFAGAENALTPALVTQLASHSRTYNIFALVEALGEPSAHQRLTSLGQLLDLGEHPAKIGDAGPAGAAAHPGEGGTGANPVELARSLGVPQWRVMSLAPAARFSDATLKGHLACCTGWTSISRPAPATPGSGWSGPWSRWGRGKMQNPSAHPALRRRPKYPTAPRPVA